MSYAQLEFIPSHVFQMRRELRGLNVSDNRLRHVPENVRELGELRVLLARYNKIRAVPVELARLRCAMCPGAVLLMLW